MSTIRTSFLVMLIFSLSFSALGPVRTDALDSRKASRRLSNQQAPSYQPTIKESDQHHILLEFSVPTYWIENLSGADKDYQQIHFPGNRWTDDPGKPQLPMVSVLVGIPRGAGLDLQIVQDDDIRLPGNYLLPPAASPVAGQGDLVELEKYSAIQLFLQVERPAGSAPFFLSFPIHSLGRQPDPVPQPGGQHQVFLPGCRL